MRHRHYIWDFDGTLFDSYPHSAAALCEAAARHGVRVDVQVIRRAMQRSFAEALSLTGQDEALMDAFRQLHGDASFPPPIVPFDDTRDALEALKREGARHYLYTHSRRRMSVAYLEKFGMAELFDDFMTPDDAGFSRKPDPGAIHALLARHGIDARDAVMVGDRALDMACADAAGIAGILLDREGLLPGAPWPRIDHLAAELL